MNNIFEAFFWLLIISIWAISILAKKRKKGTDLEKEPTWFPFPKIPAEIPQPSIEKKKEEKQIYFEVKKKNKKIEPEIVKATLPAFPAAAGSRQGPEKEEVKEEAVDLASLEKLEEGIMLSLVLGPPKAYQLYRR